MQTTLSHLLLISVLWWTTSATLNCPLNSLPVANTGRLDSNFNSETLLACTNATGDAQSPSCSYSSLWGVNGEKWQPEGRLPDFSYAGYHAGEANIPSPAAQWDL